MQFSPDVERCRRQPDRLRSLGGADHGRRAQGERRQPHRRERDEAGGQHHNLTLPKLLPGIPVSIGADDFAPIKQMQLQKFDGTTWKLFGEVISGSGN